MPLIEGIGDEVIQFVVTVFLGLIILLAWWSTGYTTTNQRFRTVVIMERNVRRLYRLMPRMTGTPHQNGITVYHYGIANSTQHMPNAVATTEAAVPNVNTNTDDNQPQDEDEVQTDTETITDSSTSDIILGDNDNNQQTDNTETTTINNHNETNDNTTQQNNDNNISTQEMEMNRIVNAMESVTCSLRNRRLAYFDQATENTDMKNDAESASTSTQSNDLTEKEQNECNETIIENRNENVEVVPNPDSIRIRLKYLNDDQKLVEGSLNEALGEFKRRHFHGEIGARKLVRLIFNGQVLQREAATLASCGLFDNCVVHCLIHQPRTPGQFAQVQQQLNSHPPSTEGSTANNINQHGPHVHSQTQTATGVADASDRDDRDWDLSHILLTILASILSIAWYCHIRFSSLFGVAASVAMLGLTGLYVFAVICVYYPESANNETQIPPPPPPPIHTAPQQANNTN